MKSESDPGILHFDGFELDIPRGELRKKGILIALQPQPFKVLALLAKHAGDVLSREEVRLQLWGRDTFVDFNGGLNFCIRQVRKALGEDARCPRYIGTLPRRGYRFLARVERSADSGGRAPFLSAGQGVREPRRTTVAVLPFQEISCSPHAGSIGDGITELLITYFSSYRSVRVVSRTSAMNYKNTGKSLLKIASELRVDWILEGAVLRSHGRVKIAARLINTATDQNEWAGCYEAETSDWLDLQNQIARAVICDTALYLDLCPDESTFCSRRIPSPGCATDFRAFPASVVPLLQKRLDA